MSGAAGESWDLHAGAPPAAPDDAAPEMAVHVPLGLSCDACGIAAVLGSSGRGIAAAAPAPAAAAAAAAAAYRQTKPAAAPRSPGLWAWAVVAGADTGPVGPDGVVGAVGAGAAAAAAAAAA